MLHPQRSGAQPVPLAIVVGAQKLASGSRACAAGDNVRPLSGLGTESWWVHGDLDYMHARYCSPVTGRFLSVDPRESRQSIKRAQAWNRYAYALGNPLRLVDPDGKEAVVFIVAPAGPDVDPKGAFGHSALLVTSGDKKVSVSYGGAYELKDGIMPCVQGYNSEGRAVSAFLLKTTPEQDQAMVEFLEKNRTGGVDGTGVLASAMLQQNCTTSVCNTLAAGGVLKPGEDANGAMSFLHAPNELQQSLVSGELSDDVEGVVVFEPKKEEENNSEQPPVN